MRLGAAVDNAVLVAVHNLLVLLRHELQDELLPPRQLGELPAPPRIEGDKPAAAV